MDPNLKILIYGAIFSTIFPGGLVVYALRTGLMPMRVGYARRDKNPGSFYMMIGLYLLFPLGFIYGAAKLYFIER
jgi:hypothetical protein